MKAITIANVLLLGLTAFAVTPPSPHRLVADGDRVADAISGGEIHLGLAGVAVMKSPRPAAGYERSAPDVVEPSFEVPSTAVLQTTYTGDESLRRVLDQGLARPTALASGDFDEDGVADLVCGYASPDGNIITLHRGNLDAIFPHSPAARQRRLEGGFTDEPFLSPAQVFEAPVRPDFLAAGDFDNDGHRDLVTAAAGEASLYLLAGDGRGGLRPAQRVRLSGAVTTMVAGEINRADGLMDLVVGVSGPDGSAVLVFEGPEGALRSAAEVLPVSPAPTALLLARLGDGPWRDLAVAAGDELLIVRGHDRRLALVEAQRKKVGLRVVERIGMPSAIEAAAWGDFAWEPIPSGELALLLEDGTIRLLGREDDPARGNGERSPVHTADDDPANAELNPGRSWRMIGQRAVRAPASNGGASPAARSLLLPVRLSGSPTDDLVFFNATGRRLEVLAGMGRGDSSPQGAAGGAASLSEAGVVASLSLEELPVAALPMRLNADALTDLVLLQPGAGAPVAAVTGLQSAITVDTATDSATAGDGLCSLREAIDNANSNSDTTGGDCAAGTGTDDIGFSIGGQGSTATITLNSALPTISDPVTIDGMTQGCASPPCIVLDGIAAAARFDGLNLAAGSSSIRGLVIHRFDGHGISISTSSSGNVLEGNFIGPDLTGTLNLGNTRSGIRIEGSNNTIGGTTAMARNVISGNDEDGVLIDNGSSGNQVLGNYIGTDASGSVGLGNTRVGVRIRDASSNTVGGTTAKARNVISGNGRNGVAILGSMSSSNLVQGNFIGTDAGGRAALGNERRGVLINNQASDNAIGGTADGAGNVIANNLEEGANVRKSGVGNSILRNSIVSNELLGIELGDTDGVTPNDSNDLDTGPNDLQNYPVLTWADATPIPDITIEGDLNTTGNADFRIEFFANRNCDGSGSGEGERFLGFTNETTLGTGNVSFSLVLSVSVSDGESIVATATNPAGSTSEFSACFTATCSNLVTFAHTITVQDKNTLLWSGPEDIRFAKGNLADVSTYTTTDDGFMPGVGSLDISADSPEPGGGLFYVIKPLGCGSWQTSLGAEPGRESGLP